jgi:hypothetical protein
MNTNLCDAAALWMISLVLLFVLFTLFQNSMQNTTPEEGTGFDTHEWPCS